MEFTRINFRKQSDKNMKSVSAEEEPLNITETYRKEIEP